MLAAALLLIFAEAAKAICRVDTLALCPAIPGHDQQGLQTTPPPTFASPQGTVRGWQQLLLGK